MMKQKMTALILSMTVLAMLLAGCSERDLAAATEQMKQEMESSGYFAPKKVTYRFPAKEEAAEIFFSDEEYFNNLSQTDLDLRMHKAGATLDEYKAFAEEQVLEFTEEEQKVVEDSMDRVQERLDAIGFSYPVRSSIDVLKTTMEEEGDLPAYTRDGQLYLGQEIVSLGMRGKEADKEMLDEIITQGLFHIISGKDRNFRLNMNRVIGFALDPDEPEFTESVKERLASNPDVKSYDSHATFTINGKPTEATVVAYYPDREFKEDAVMIEEVEAGVVPVDQPDKIYPVEEVEDFYKVMGNNADKITSASDCLAINFTEAVMNGLDGQYENPGIIREMLDYMASGKPTEQATGDAMEKKDASAYDVDETAEAEGEAAEAADDVTPAGSKGNGNITDIAQEVIQGLWGNGPERVQRLEAAGYDPDEVQKEVNRILK